MMTQRSALCTASLLRARGKRRLFCSLQWMLFTCRLGWSVIPMGQIQRYPIWIYDVAVTFKPGLSFNWHCQWITCPCKLRARSIHISQIVSKEHAFACEIFGQLRSGAFVFCTLHDKVKISHTCNERRSANEWIARHRSVGRAAKPKNANLTLYHQDGQSIYFKIDH